MSKKPMTEAIFPEWPSFADDVTRLRDAMEYVVYEPDQERREMVKILSELFLTKLCYNLGFSVEALSVVFGNSTEPEEPLN